MKVPRLSTKLLLRPEDLPASRDDFEVIGAFNPGAAIIDDEVVLLVRVAERPKEKRPGFQGMPRWDPNDGLTVDWVPDHEHEPIDSRVVRHKCSGLVRLTFNSHLRVVRCGDGRSVREVTDVTFRPESEVEEFGVEDPRITYIEGRFYLTYVAVSRRPVGRANVARIVAPPEETKTGITLPLCAERGLHRAFVSRRQRELFTALRRAKWGDTILSED